MNYEVKLSSDAPIIDPAEDAYGFAGFAKSLARAIRATPSPSGLVMAINGPWGAGKSSLLNFIKHDLRSTQDSECPIIIDFNPWWFNDRDQLASQLLAQFALKVRGESKTLLTIGGLLAEYSGALSKAVALSTGVLWIDKPVNALLKLLKRHPREVPEIKAEIAKALEGSKRRVLFVIDDLDRLTPDEIRELFKVIKALADFPNVIYLLSFDKQVVAAALSRSLGVDGSAYLEKIVQAQFLLPAVDKLLLQNKVFAGLSTLVDSLPQSKFDSTYWGNVYFDGLDHYIRKPRDVVRLINALTVTYPPVAGEVNPVDFIALEFLRVFKPNVYSTLRDNREMFVGVLRDTKYANDDVKRFHESWLAEVEPPDRAAVKALVERLFPKVESALGGMGYGSDFLGTWRQELRACSSDLFGMYFQFGVPQDYLTQAEITNLLALSADGPVLIETFKAARRCIRPDGRSKAKDYVDRLRQLKDEEISPIVAARLMIAIFALEEDFLLPSDERGGSMSIPNRWRVSWLIERLLDRVPKAGRVDLIMRCIHEGKAYSTMIDLVRRLADGLVKPENAKPFAEGIDEAAVNAMKTEVLVRLEVAPLEAIFATSDTVIILSGWSQWGDLAKLKAKLAPVLSDDTLLVQFLVKYLQTGSSHAFGDRVARTTYHLNPRALEPYFDLEVVAARIEPMLASLEVQSQERIAVERFMKGMTRVREGMPTDGQTMDELFDRE